MAEVMMPHGGTVTMPLGRIGPEGSYPTGPYLGTGDPNSEMDRIRDAFGPSVTTSSQPRGQGIVSPHQTLYSTANQTLYINMPDVLTATYIAADLLLEALLSVVNRIQVPIDVGQIVVRDIKFDVGRFVPAAPFTHGPVIGAESKEQTFSMGRFVLGAEIEWILKQTTGGSQIWNRFMASMVNALRFTYTDLIINCFNTNANRPTAGSSNGRKRNWVEVAAEFMTMTFAASKSQSGLIQWAKEIINEGEARGLMTANEMASPFNAVVISNRTAVALTQALHNMQSSMDTPVVSVKSTLTTIPSDLGAPRTGPFSALLSGAKVIRIGHGINNNQLTQPLANRIIGVEAASAIWRSHLEDEIKDVRDADPALVPVYYKNVGFELDDWENGVTTFHSLFDLYANAAFDAEDGTPLQPVSPSKPAEYKTFVDQVLKDRIPNRDLRIYRVFGYTGDFSAVLVSGCCTLANTSLITKEGVNVFSKKMDLQSVIFAVCFCTEPNKVFMAPPLVPQQLVVGGSTRFITYNKLASKNFDLSALDCTDGLLVVLVPKYTDDQANDSTPFSTIHGFLPEFLGRNGEKLLWGTDLSSENLKQFFKNVAEQEDSAIDPSPRGQVPLVTAQAHHVLKRLANRALRDIFADERTFYERFSSGIHGPVFYPLANRDLFQQQKPWMLSMVEAMNSRS